MMVETHVLNTFLQAAFWSEPWRVQLNYFNGIVAPSFLFIAGYGHGLGLVRRRLKPGPATARFVRIAGIAALGYAMHAPIGQLLHGQWAEAWRIGSQMDVLVCLAFALAGLVALEQMCGRMVMVAVSVATLAVLSAAPALVSWTAGPLPLVAAVNQTTGSLFPLLPWAAFVFCGFGVSQRPASWLGVLPAVLGCAAVVAWVGRANLSATSAAFFFERLGWVLALVPVCAWLSVRWAPRWLLFAGRESLVVYLAHLAILELLAAVLGRNQFGLAASLALYPAVLAASFAVAQGWRRVSVWRADRARRGGRRPESSATAA